MKFNFNFFALSTLILIALSSCKKNSEKIKSVDFWKYSDGFHIGDVVDFKENKFNLKNDTIFRGNYPVAKLENLTIIPIIEIQKMTIKDLKTNKKGNYSGK